uniref:A-kinase anchor protein 7 RI-RII subunit-binding domain-containing protein n=1 Tax=Suricata suricatta TaxID=37032 RepID=A0A673VF40_SURSU
NLKLWREPAAQRLLLRRRWRLQCLFGAGEGLWSLCYLWLQVGEKSDLPAVDRLTGEKPGNEPEEVKLQKASKQIVQNVILQAVQQVSQESQQREGRRGAKEGSFRLGVGELTKKHEKK